MLPFMNDYKRNMFKKVSLGFTNNVVALIKFKHVKQVVVTNNYYNIWNRKSEGSDLKLYLVFWMLWVPFTDLSYTRAYLSMPCYATGLVITKLYYFN